MANWMTADEIGDLYVVGAERLAAYAARGNLACRRPEGGVTLYDEAQVARFFRPRSGGIVVSSMPQGEHLGVLGLARLGDAPGHQGAFTQGRRHRPLRSDVAPKLPGQAPDVILPLRKRA